jgi:hypothetical protein
MKLFSWLLQRVTGRPQKQRVPARRVRPQLETLERRDVLTTLAAPLGADLYSPGVSKISKDSTVAIVGP